MLPNIGDIIILTTYTGGLNAPEKHGPMMIVGDSKAYGSRYRECYMIETGEKKTYMISPQSHIEKIQ
jgi:hypothetical protein